MNKKDMKKMNKNLIILSSALFLGINNVNAQDLSTEKFNIKSVVINDKVQKKQDKKEKSVLKNEKSILKDEKLDLPLTATKLPSLEEINIKNIKNKDIDIANISLNTEYEKIKSIENKEFEKDKKSKNLLDLYQDALKNNSTWIASQSQNLAVKEKQNQAYAGLLPTINFQGSYYKSNTNQKSVKSKIPYDENFAYDSYNYSLNLRQPIYRKYNKDLYEQSKIQANHADYVLEQEFQDLAVKVASAYFEVLLAKANLQVSQIQKNAYNVYLEYAQKTFEKGVGTRVDIDEAQAKLDNEIAREIQLEYQLNMALNQLSTLTKQDLKSIRDLDFEKIQFISPRPNILSSWVQQAFLYNPSILAAKEQIKIADKEIDKAKSGHYPTLDLVAYASKSQSDTSSTINSQYRTSAVGMQLNIPIYEGGRINSTIKENQYLLKNKEALLDGTYEDIKLQVKKEFDTINQSLRWIKAYQTSLQSAKQALISTQKGFQAGTRKKIDILDAHQNLSQVKLNLNKSVYDYIIARVRLLALVGQMDINQVAFFNTWIY